ncbi:MAG: hypothetical protein KU29_02250 [Sulfurovum sp. FS06-10]|nr:MAG: hypothetical protein KU29_02250 [Sulfurovum sp. FS06-10]
MIVLSKFASIVLGTMVLAGAYASYEFGNFNGISRDTLEKEYLPKNAITFDDLPHAIKTRYIDKEATIDQSKEGNLLEDVYRDEQGNIINEADVTPRDLRRMIQKLQKTLLFLQHDNLLMTNEKNELTKRVEEQKNEFEEAKEQLAKQNLEKINEAEQQHYRNISDLTMKINELQKENVIIAQKANIEANTLHSMIEELKAKAIEEENKKRFEIKQAREDEQSKLSDYKDKIKLLNDQIALLNEQISTTNESAKNTFVRKQEEITKLKDEVTKNTQEKNELLTKQAQLLANIDQKHKDEIAQYSTTVEQLKNDTQKLILKHRQDLSIAEEEYLKKAALLGDQIKTLENELASNKKHIDALMLENEKDFAKFRAYLEDEKKLNKELTAASKKVEENALLLEKSLNASLLKQNETLVQKEVKIKDLESKIVGLEKEKIDIEAAVKQRVDENDKIHNKNYRIFNEKIAKFDASKQELIAKLDKQLDEYKAASEENHKKMQFHTQELARANSELKQNYEAKEKELTALKNELVMVKLESQKVTQVSENSLKELKSSLDALRLEAKQKEAEALTKMQAFEANIRAKDIALAALKREEGLKVAALEKELTAKEVDRVALQDTLARKEESLKTLHVKLKNADENATKATTKQLQELKDKLTTLEKNYAAETLKVTTLKEEFKRKELAYLDEIKTMQNSLKTKESMVAQATSKAPQPKTPSPKGAKLQVVDTITCTDMGTGVNAISETCQKDVKAFLAKFDSSYFYEVAPIVDNGGFASLKLIKSKKVGVEDSEIDRISGLANIGLGKARAKAGGELVESIVGEGAKISYALSNIEQNKARGFQIKVLH